MRAYEFISELDQGRRGFLKRLGKGAVGAIGAAALSTLPAGTAQAGTFNDRECRALWQFGYDVMKAVEAGADRDRISDLYLERTLNSMRASYKYNDSIVNYLEQLIDLALTKKGKLTPVEYAKILHTSCLK